MGPHLRVPRPHILVGEGPDTGMVKVEATTTGLQIIQLNSINVISRNREVAASRAEAEIVVARPVEAVVESEDPKIKIDTVEWKCSPYDNFWSKFWPNFGLLVQILTQFWSFGPNFGPILVTLPIPTLIFFLLLLSPIFKIIFFLIFYVI